MTHEEITERIRHIEDLNEDPESAHIAEDDLYLNFIKYIASLDLGDVSNKAQGVISTQDFDFPRWYA